MYSETAMREDERRAVINDALGRAQDFLSYQRLQAFYGSIVPFRELNNFEREAARAAKFQKEHPILLDVLRDGLASDHDRLREFDNAMNATKIVEHEVFVGKTKQSLPPGVGATLYLSNGAKIEDIVNIEYNNRARETKVTVGTEVITIPLSSIVAVGEKG